MPLNRYKRTQKISEIPMKLSVNRSINFIELDKTSSLYYKKCLRIKTLAIHKSYTLDNNYCSALIKNNFDRIQNLFPLLFHKKQRFRFWKVRLDLIMRIANLEEVQPVALQELNEIMEKQFADIISESHQNPPPSLSAIVPPTSVFQVLTSDPVIGRTSVSISVRTSW